MLTEPTEVVRSRLADRRCRIVRDRGDRFDAQCPVHDDRRESLSVGTSQDGRVLVHCHAGCETNDVLRSLGLTYRDLSPISSPRIRRPNATSSSSTSPEHFSGNKGDHRVRFDDDAPLWRALEEFMAGRRELEFEVRLSTDRLPPQAATLRSLAQKIALAMSLMVSDGVTRPLPISGSCAAKLLGLDPFRDDRRCRGLLDRLVERRVLSEREPLDPMPGRPHGTRTFEPYEMTLAEIFDSGAAAAADRRPFAVELDVEPNAEVVDEPAVDGAVTGSREDIRVVATGDRALSWNRPYPAGTGSRFHRVHDVDSTAAGDGEAENVETLVDAFRELFDATEVS